MMVMMMMNYKHLRVNAAPRFCTILIKQHKQDCLHTLHSCAAGFGLQLCNLGLQCRLLLLELLVLHMRP